jgi:hypothetical protein
MRSKSVPTHEGVVAELMRRELGIPTKAADESARRLPQEADAGGLSKEIVVPFRSLLLRPIRSRQSAHIKTGTEQVKAGKCREAGVAQPAFGPVGAATQRDGPSDLPAIEA